EGVRPVAVAPTKGGGEPLRRRMARPSIQRVRRGRRPAAGRKRDGAELECVSRNSAAETTRTTCPFASRIFTGAMESSPDGRRTVSWVAFIGRPSSGDAGAERRGIDGGHMLAESLAQEQP